ncbi:unnamed protein product [Allacma fusca]|uniref:Uncharacterized protein n=1 Tax=Allacma fusca TaxID=39272 RepID=A0A8J2NTV5_9HEXA|nr:unnamed protein product [Allacma fusca]
MHRPDRLISSEEMSFMKDGEWLSNYMVEQYLKRLLEAYDAEARQKSLTILPEGIVSKQTEGPNAGNWKFQTAYVIDNIDFGTTLE